MDSWKDISYGKLSTYSTYWVDFNDENPHLWDECDETLLEAGVYYLDEDGEICVNENIEEED